MKTLARRSPAVFLTLVIAAALGLAPAAANVSAAECPPFACSTNDINIANGWSHVSLVGQGPGTVTLEFVQPRIPTFAAYFEYRIDGETAGTLGHLVLGPDEWTYPGVGVGGGYLVSSKVRTFSAASTVEIRLALGAEHKERFDWVTFDVGPNIKADCKQDGWTIYGFENQGACIKFVKDREHD